MPAQSDLIDLRLSALALALVLVLAIFAVHPASTVAEPITSWGGTGSGTGQFTHIGGLAVGPSGDVYASDTNLVGGPRIEMFAGDGGFERQWGSLGSGDGEMNHPLGLATNSAGDIYVADSTNHRLEVFDATGSFLRTFGSHGQDSGKFEFPGAVSVASDGSTYVTDDGPSKLVQKFDLNGAFVTSWGGSGSGNGQFSLPGSVGTDSVGRIYVADNYGQRIQRFGSDGAFQLAWPVTDSQPLLAVGPTDNVFATQTTGGETGVVEYDSAGALLGSARVPDIGEAGPSPAIGGIAVSPAGIVYVASAVRIYRVDPSEPMASLVDAGPVLTGAKVRLDASASQVPFHTPDFAWDLDGDGAFEVDTAGSPILSTSFKAAGSRRVKVRVTAPSGKAAVASIKLDVRPAPPHGPVGVSINGGDFATNDPKVNIDAVWPRFSTRALLSNDGGFRGGQAASRALKEEMEWTLRSAGPERLPKTVYVRFVGTNRDSQTFSDDIVLDTTTPKILGSGLEGSPTGASARVRVRSAGRVYRVRIRASAALSGVSTVNVSTRRGGGVRRVLTNPRRRGISRLNRVVSVRLQGRPRYVRVRNAAGTWSRWRKVG